MANLFRLLQIIGERVACKNESTPSSSSPSSQLDEDPLEARFRSVIPNLLHAYVLPSSTAKESEVNAILKLLSHVSRTYPGVFFHGKSFAVLPIIGRLLLLFAEPTFSSQHAVIFETVSSLLSLLRTGEREAYRQFFLDAMLVVEDLLSVTSIYAATSPSTTLSLKCFCDSFSVISIAPSVLSDLPACCKPMDEPGILVEVTKKSRWQLFGTWMIKVLSKCLTEGTLQVEGLISPSFMCTTGSLLCHGDAAFHMALFDFTRIAAAVLDAKIVPSEGIILSIASILGQDEQKLSMFRNSVYDSSIGACLLELHSSCQKDVVERTARDLLNVFPQSLRSTESTELKVAICSAYIRIAKICPPHIWRPEALLNILSSSKPCMQLIDCIRVAIDILGPHSIGGEVVNDTVRTYRTDSSGEVFRSSTIGVKRIAPETADLKCKRKKTERERLSTDANVQNGSQDTLVDNLLDSSHITTYPRQQETTSQFTCELDKDSYAFHFKGFLVEFFGHLKPGDFDSSILTEENALVALSMLCIALCNYPITSLSLCLFQEVLAWVPWICKQTKERSSVTFDLFIYLEAVHSILLLQSVQLFKDEDDVCTGGIDIRLIFLLLKLPWTHSLLESQAHPLWKIKRLSVQVLSKLGVKLKNEIDLDVLDMALNDENEEVRVEAVISMPVIVLSSGCHLLAAICRRLENLGQGE